MCVCVCLALAACVPPTSACGLLLFLLKRALAVVVLTEMSQFLKPTKAERARLCARREDVERAKKAASKVKAADRRRKRDEDAETRCTVDGHLLLLREQSAPAPAPAPAPALREERATAKIDAFLASPPYFGHSERRDNVRIKELCGEGCHRVFDRTRKMWGTTLAGYLEKLVNSQLWLPFGIEREWFPQLLVAAKQRVAVECAPAADAARRSRSSTPLACEQSQPLPLKRVVPTSQDILMLQASVDEARLCAELGLVANTILASKYFTELGPRLGLSNEGRLLRWVEIAKSDVRREHESSAIYFDAARMQPFENRAIATLVQQLNERASRARTP